MPQYVVPQGKELTVLGKTYKTGQVVPMEKLEPRRAKQLIEHRKVEADSIKVRGKAA